MSRHGGGHLYLDEHVRCCQPRLDRRPHWLVRRIYRFAVRCIHCCKVSRDVLQPDLHTCSSLDLWVAAITTVCGVRECHAPRQALCVCCCGCGCCGCGGGACREVLCCCCCGCCCCGGGACRGQPLLDNGERPCWILLVRCQLSVCHLVVAACFVINSLDRTSRSHALLDTPWSSGTEAVQIKPRRVNR